METLHDDDDWGVGTVLPAFHCRAEPVEHVLSHDGTVCLPGLVRVINHDGPAERGAHFASAIPSDTAFSPCGIYNAALFGAELVLRLGVLRQRGVIEYMPVNLMHHRRPDSVGVGGR